MAEENGRVWAPEVRELGDRIVALTVSKAVELGDYMEQVHKIKPAASAVAMAAGPAATVAPEKPPEQTEFAVVPGAPPASMPMRFFTIYDWCK